MKKEVVLTIVGLQRINGEDKSIELITMGTICKRKSIYYLEYEDSILTGFEGNKTLISIDGEKISLERVGSYRSQFLFEKGKKYVNFFYTPFGFHELGIYPTSIEMNIRETHGKLDLKYHIDIAGQFAGISELSVSYHTKASNNSTENKLEQS